MATSLEHMTADEVGEWLTEHGFSEDIVAAFEENDMDGYALSLAFAAQSGPDCLKDVVQKYGLRLKVYQAIKAELEAERCQTSNSSLDSSGIGDDLSMQKSDKTFSAASDQASTSCSKKSEPSSCSKKTGAMKSPTQVTPNPFPIPMFRVDTQASLKERRIGDDDRRYMIRVLATVLCTYVQRPSMRDCEIVAKSLVAKYSFLKEHESWQRFLYIKCQNLNRKQENKSPDGNAPAKRQKVDKSNHEYPSTLVEIEDDTTHKRNYDALILEGAKPTPKADILMDLMKRTFGRRRLWILESERLVLKICEDYPPLKKSSYIMQEFEMVMSKNSLFEVFESSWPKWETAVLGYATGTKNKTQGLCSALKDLHPASDSDTEDEEEHTSSGTSTITALRCLAYFLCKKEKAKSTTREKATDNHIPYILREVPRGTPNKEAIDSNNNFPHIVVFVDDELDILPRYHIAVEQVLLVECRSLTHALYCLLAIHYVFNIKYHPRAEDFFMFLFEKVLGIQEAGRQRKKKKSASYLSATTAIECYTVTDSKNSN